MIWDHWYCTVLYILWWDVKRLGRLVMGRVVWEQGFGAGNARSRGIWLEPDLKSSLWPGSGSSLTFSLIIHANCIVNHLFWYLLSSKKKLATIYTSVISYFRQILTLQKMWKYTLSSGAGAGSGKKNFRSRSRPKTGRLWNPVWEPNKSGFSQLWKMKWQYLCGDIIHSFILFF